jgi:CheY-specific phosphatase CheX
MKPKVSSTMNIEKHVLVVDEPEGVLSGLMSEFNQLGYRVIWIPSASAALAFLKSSPKLSLLVVSAVILEQESDDFIAQAREFEPGLRIIRGTRADTKRWLSNRAGAEAVLGEPLRAEELRNAASRLLADHFDLRPAADAVSLAAVEVLSTLGTFRIVGNVFLKANQAVLSDLSAMIPFSGDVSGHLMMSIMSQDARELHRRLVPNMSGPTLDRLEDLVGELCNQIMGHIANRFSSHALNINQTTPIFIRSAGATLRYRGRQPSLGLELSDGTVQAFIELYLEQFDGTKLALPPSSEAIQRDEIHFF